MHRRSWLLLIALPLYTLVLCALATVVVSGLVDGWSGIEFSVELVLSPARWDLQDGMWWVYCGAPVLVLVASQIVFLLPIVRMRPTIGGRARSMTLTVVALALVVGLLSAGVVYALLDAILLAVDPDLDTYDLEIGAWDETGRPWWWYAMAITRLPIVLLPVCWLIWTIMLIVFARRRPIERWWGRVIGLLLAGTILELAIVTPVDVMVRRRGECYCATGTFLALTFAAFSLLWLTGPGIIIAFTSRRRGLWRDSHCLGCGYARGPSPGPQCPECGSNWQNRPGRAGRQEEKGD